MAGTIQFNTSISINQLAMQLRKQLSINERTKLAKLLQTEDEEKEPSSEEILNNLQKDYKALQNGTLKTRPLKDVLNEL
jgi:hypothetical protein